MLTIYNYQVVPVDDDVEVFVTLESRETAAGVKRLIWEKSGQYGRTHYWVSIPAGYTPEFYDTGWVTLPGSRTTQGVLSSLRTAYGTFAVLPDWPEHRLTSPQQ